MKNIKELGLELIELEDQVLLVDKKLPVFTDDWALELYNGDSKATTSKWIDDKNNVWWLRKMNMNCLSNDPECIKVLTSTKPLEGLPLLVIEDEVDIITKNEVPDRIYKSGVNYAANEQLGFKKGYNKAKETYKYTEEDIWYIVDLFLKKVPDSIDVRKEIENLTKKELWIEIEDKIAIDGHTIIGIEPKITDNKIKGIWK